MGGKKDEEFQQGGAVDLFANKFADDGEFDDDGKPKRTGTYVFKYLLF